MSDYKMVPLVATEGMVAAIRDRGTQDGDCVGRTTAQMMWADALDESPPFVVTDELVESVWMAATGRARYGKAYEGDAQCMTDDERADVRAAIEAVLGGGK